MYNALTYFVNETFMENKQKNLKKHKLYALLLLVFALCLFIFAQYYHITWLKALSEAALVGGLADWFAVVALFRHPMGLPIKHTALIPNNKNHIGENLGQFVAEEFLTRERLEPKINELNFAEKGSHWLAEKENAQKISDLIVKDLIPGILNVINDEDVMHFIHIQFNNKLHSINFGEWLGTGIDALTKDGRHQELLTNILENLYIEFHNNKNRIYKKVSEKTPAWTLGLVDEKIANGIINAIDEFLCEAKHPSSDVRKKVDHYMVDFVENIKSSPEIQEKINIGHL